MPSYDYKCGKCGVEETVERSIHAESSAPMHCDNLMDRIFFAAPVRFNADGFYSTDNIRR